MPRPAHGLSRSRSSEVLDTRGRWAAPTDSSASRTSPRVSWLLAGVLGVLLAMALAKLGVDVAGVSAASSEGEVRQAAQGGCGDIDLVVAGGVTFCTHGPDPAPPGLDASEAVSPLVGAAEVSKLAACEGDGVSGARVEVIYARAADVADRYGEYVNSFRSWAGDADRIVRASAAETGGFRAIRFVTTPPMGGACEVVVRNVVLSAAGDDAIMDTARELAELGYDRADRKYMIFMDATLICGQGSILYDYRRDAANGNNMVTGYGRIDAGCWGGSVAAHELAHNLGAVQYNARNSSFGAHCTDEYDRMCYSDDPHHPAMRFVCGDPSRELILDCNHDDYFHTDPPAGSFLDQFWNMASSRFLIGAVDRPAMGPPANDAIGEAIRFGGAPLDDVRAVRAATSAASDPESSCQSPGGGGASVWYRTTPAVAGTLSMTARHSDYDTMITVFTGREGDLTEVACNNDQLGGVAAELSMPVTAGTTYRVMVTAGSNALVPWTLRFSAQGPAGSKPPPLLTLDKISSKFNGMVTARLTGLTPDARVTLSWDDGTVLGTIDTGPDGAASLRFRTPLAPFGPHSVTARTSGGQTVETTLRVIPRTMLNEVTGGTATRLRVYLYGFSAGERVEVRWHAAGPKSSAYVLLRTLTVAANGRASTMVTIPRDAALGEHLVVGRVIGVGRSASATFRVTALAPNERVTRTATPTREAIPTSMPTATGEATSEATRAATATLAPEPSTTAVPSTPTAEATAIETAVATVTAATTDTATPEPTPSSAPKPTRTGTSTPQPNASPSAVAGEDQTVLDADGSGEEAMSLDGGGSFDPEGDQLTYGWSLAGVEVASGPTATVTLPVGVHVVVLTVTDGRGGIGTDELSITVEGVSPDAPG